MGMQLLRKQLFTIWAAVDRRHDYTIAHVVVLGLGIIIILIRGTQLVFYALMGVCQTMYGMQLLVDANEYLTLYRLQ